MTKRNYHPIKGDKETATYAVSVLPVATCHKMNNDKMTAQQLRCYVERLSSDPRVEGIGIWQHRDDLGEGCTRLVGSWTHNEAGWIFES